MPSTHRAQPKTAESGDQAQLPLPAEIEQRVDHWRDLVAQAGIASRRELSVGEVERRWELGCEMAQAIAGPLAGQPKTALMRTLARRLGCSRALIYEFTAVAEAFPDELPRQQWHVLVELAHLDEASRKQWLPSWPDQVTDPAALKALAKERGRKRGKVTPEAAAGREQMERLWRAALQAFDELAPMMKPAFVVGTLERLDLGSLFPSARFEILRRIESAVAALRNQAPGLAADGATLDGADDPPR